MEKQIVKHWVRLRAWAPKHKSVILFSIAIAIIVVTGGGLLYVLTHVEEANLNTSKVLPKPKPVPKPKSPLTGVEVADDATTKRQVTAIMIENSQDARPQSGVKQAGIVYEAIAEGGITRFLCLYQEARPGLIGPVRSVRPYYVDWLAPYDAAVAHIGGSRKALDEVRNGSYKDIDQFFNAGAYYRAKDRYAPHNVYTTFDRLDALNTAKGFTSSTFTGFPRKTNAPPAAPTAASINVQISSASFNSSYVYDQPNNRYLRSEGGVAHNDREDGQITPNVVIVMKVAMSLGQEDGWREQIQTIGSGTSYVFQDGIVTQGTWTKASKKEQIVFKDPAGTPIALNAGQTWITAIPNEKNVTWQ